MSRTSRVSDEEWCEDEFSSVDLGDKRLNKRIIKIALQFLHQPQGPINKACGGWADTKAAYRLFANSKVSSEEVLLAHQLRVIERIMNQSVILAIQDSTFLKYDSHIKTQGLGGIAGNQYRKTLGLMMHTVLAVSPDGVPFGILGQKIWSRINNPKNIGMYRKQIPIKKKESWKWIQALEDMLDLTNQTNVKIVTVCDRESDVYELLLRAEQLKTGILIRASNDRLLFGSKRDAKRSRTVWKHMQKAVCRGVIEIEITDKIQKYSIRKASTEVRFEKVELRPPQRRPPAKKLKLSPLTIYAVWVIEPHPPKGIEPVEWMLLTNVPVIGFDDALERINWYKQRWGIENLHKVIKSGLKVEDCRLETADRLKPYLTLCSIIAWRIYWMTQVIRQHPDAPCTDILTNSEWKALYAKIHGTNVLPMTPPTTREAIRWIAQLGGFLARKWDKEPGTITIWRGWQRLADIADSWKLFHSDST